MTKWIGPALPAVLLALFLTGCGDQHAAHTGAAPDKKNDSSAGTEKDARIRANLDKLDPEDRKIAEEQKYCAVENENRLGGMGKPVKVELDGQTVFLCCKGCLAEAKEHKEKTLARAKELREKNKTP